jgi:hypothetical protein
MTRKTPKKRPQQREKQQQQQQQSPGSTKRLETINESVVAVFEVPFYPPPARSPRTFEVIVIVTILLFLIGALAWAAPETSPTVWKALKAFMVEAVCFTVSLPFVLAGMVYRIVSGQWTFFDGVIVLWGWLVVIVYYGTRYLLKQEYVFLSSLSFFTLILSQAISVQLLRGRQSF